MRLFTTVPPHLNEVERRVFAGAMARELRRGGKIAVAATAGLSRNTVIKAQAEVDAGTEPSQRLRAPDGGDWRGRPGLQGMEEVRRSILL